MQLRCYRCGWSFAIRKEELAFALSALRESEGSHYDVRCPRCRHMNRVSLEQLEKFAPKLEDSPAAQAEGAAEPEAPAAAADAQGGSADEAEGAAEPETPAQAAGAEGGSDAEAPEQ